MRETKDLEFKEQVTNSFLKTVSAFANYGNGEILFGITDRGEVKGVTNPVKVCLDIENKINDSLDPVPEYTLSVNEKTSVITLRVTEGLHKPYFYKSKAYRRNDTASVPVDRLELKRLILEGQNLSFEELPADRQDLSFAILEKKLKTELGLQTVNMDTLKTLELYTDGRGYNIAAELLADSNDFCGVDMARFGDSISIILDRECHEHISILDMYDKALAMYRKYYQYEEIKGSKREQVELIPEASFREAVANAIVHRTWDVEAHINVAMFPDRIEITSPGGLPKGLDRDEYLRGGISVLRNRIIGGVFYRLHMIERFGTGIRRINDEYRGSRMKPDFEIMENTIRIVLPVMTATSNLLPDEERIYKLLRGREMASSALAEAAGFGKSKTIGILRKLVEAGYVRVLGKGRGTRYTAV